MKRSLASAACGLVLLTACSSAPSEDPTGGGTAEADDCPVGSDRTVTIAHDTRPEDLHPFREGPRITAWINQGLYEGLWGIDGNHDFVPELLAAEPTFETHVDESVTVTMQLRPSLRWSDGTALTSDDVEGTWRLIMEQADDGDFVLEFGERTGYELIHPDSWEHDTAAGTFSFLLTEPFGGLRNLFTLVLPTHVLDSAAAANLALASGRAGIDVLPTSGPLRLETFSDRGALELVRNDAYHGSVVPGIQNQGRACIPGVRLLFASSPERMAELLIDADVDLIVGDANRSVAELIVARPDVRLGTVNGLSAEHWGFNLRNDHLADPLVRRAIASAIDKQAVIDAVYAPIHGDGAPVPLDSFFSLPGQQYHESHQQQLGNGDAVAARQLLSDAGYEPEGDGWTHPERGPLLLRVATPPDAVRQAQFSVVQRQLEAAGIVVTLEEDADILDDVVFSDAALLCSREGSSGTPGVVGDSDTVTTPDCDLWDIAQFTWNFASPWPGGQVSQFTTGSVGNPYGVADESIDALGRRCLREMGLEEAANCFNQLDRQVLGPAGQPGVVIVPLAQRSTVVAWRDDALASVPQASDAAGAGLFARAAEFVARGGLATK